MTPPCGLPPPPCWPDEIYAPEAELENNELSLLAPMSLLSIQHFDINARKNLKLMTIEQLPFLFPEL